MKTIEEIIEEIEQVRQFIKKEWYEHLKNQYDTGDGRLIYNRSYNHDCEQIVLALHRLGSANNKLKKIVKNAK